MRISINLATRPFVELRPLLARLRLVMGGLTLLALALALGVYALSRKAADATFQMDLLRDQTVRVQSATAANEAKMRRPENQGVLARTQFLNTLFARKGFSWTAVMMDLEHVLPQGVQVTAIDPVVSKQGDVSIRLRVTGDRDRAIQLVRNLERTDRFIGPRLVGESALNADKARAIGAGQTSPGGFQNISAPGEAPVAGVEFEIMSGYTPLLERRIAQKGEVNHD